MTFLMNVGDQLARINAMSPHEDIVLAVAEIVRDSAAMNDAALAGDFDEARFRAQLIVAKADGIGLLDVVLAAAYVMDRLGQTGAEPQKGYGESMLRLAHTLDNIGFEPL